MNVVAVFPALISWVAVVAAGGIILAWGRAMSDEPKWAPYVLRIGLFIALVGGTGFVAETLDWAESNRAAVRERYGVELTRTQVRELMFPIAEPPAAARLGTTGAALDPGAEPITIALYFDGHRLLLGTPDSRGTVTELPTIDRTDGP